MLLQAVNPLSPPFFFGHDIAKNLVSLSEPCDKSEPHDMRFADLELRRFAQR
jgi:hypothetical protein